MPEYGQADVIFVRGDCSSETYKLQSQHLQIQKASSSDKALNCLKSLVLAYLEVLCVEGQASYPANPGNLVIYIRAAEHHVAPCGHAGVHASRQYGAVHANGHSGVFLRPDSFSGRGLLRVRVTDKPAWLSCFHLTQGDYLSSQFPFINGPGTLLTSMLATSSATVTQLNFASDDVDPTGMHPRGASKLLLRPCLKITAAVGTGTVAWPPQFTEGSGFGVAATFSTQLSVPFNGMMTCAASCS